MLKSYFTEGVVEAGCDEAGRGCLSGPVYAAAVILPPRFRHSQLNDSKQIPEPQRYKLREVIERKAMDYAVGIASVEEIDEINILNASFLAMHRALEKLRQVPAHVIIDGNRFNSYGDIPHTCIVGGDGLYFSIAAASILAKTYRDDFMRDLHREFPQYCWDTNKGYATVAHRRAIKEYGTTKWHRKSFNMFDPQLEIEF
jgi:ribonuclease HII